MGPEEKTMQYKKLMTKTILSGKICFRSTY